MNIQIKMKIYLYNSLSNKKEEFIPITDNLVKMYSCGPTVYNYAHIGNMRSFLFADLLYRVLKIAGNYDVNWVMNITDIDDKTIRDSKLGSTAWNQKMGEQTDDSLSNLNKLTTYYLELFKSDISKLGIEVDNFYKFPRATFYIKEMQSLVKKIFDNGFAYVSHGSVYFDVNKWKNTYKYGRLKQIDFDNFKSGQRIDTDEYEREQVSDFVLWKSAKKDEPSWGFTIDNKNCQGRPGWHLECSTMEYEIFGLPFDIHTGGVDLKFPHHEDEIAQSYAGYGIDPTRYWCHNEFLEVEGEKMSKTADNFFILNDLIQRGFDPLDIRLLMLSQHYSTKFNFTFDGLNAQKKTRARIQEFIYKLFDDNGNDKEDIDALTNNIFIHLANDLHTPKALAELFTFVNKNKNKKFNSDTKNKLINLFSKLNAIFAVWKIEKRKINNIEIPDSIKLLASQRFEAKQNKDWAKSDAFRDQITKAGYIIKDMKTGYEIFKQDE